MAEPEAVRAPRGGLWRVARGANPLAPPPQREVADGGVNRFDPLTIDCGVLYFGSDLDTCFGETSPACGRAWRSLPWSRKSGERVASWTQGRWRRIGASEGPPCTSDFRRTHSSWMRNCRRRTSSCAKSWHSGFPALGFGDLDVAAVRGPDRRVTRLIADWAYLAEDEGRPRYAGVRYESRLRSGWECWALFDDEDMELEVIETLPVTREMPALQRVAGLFELRVF